MRIFGGRFEGRCLGLPGRPCTELTEWARRAQREAANGDCASNSRCVQTGAPPARADRCGEHAIHHTGHGEVVELVGRVAWAVVVVVAEEGGVGDHEGGETFLLEAPVVGPAHVAKRVRDGDAEHGERRVGAKGGACLLDDACGVGVADAEDEVADAWKKPGERGGGPALGARLVLEAADGFEGEHGADVVGALLAEFRVDPTAHRLFVEVGRLFVREAEETNGAGERGLCEAARDGEGAGDAGAVVVGGGAVVDGVVVRAEEDDALGMLCAAEGGFEVVALDAVGAVGIAADLVAGAAEGRRRRSLRRA